MNNTFEINGKTYKEIEREKPKSYSRAYSSIYAMMAMSYGLTSFSHNSQVQSKTFDIDIIKEFELILNKKSNLSKSQRDWVVRQFNLKYKEVEV